jgi:hypothetical protein
VYLKGQAVGPDSEISPDVMRKKTSDSSFLLEIRKCYRAPQSSKIHLKISSEQSYYGQQYGGLKKETLRRN